MHSVGFIVVCYQYILFAFTGCNWEPSCLVCINVTYQIHCLEEDNIGSF